MSRPCARLAGALALPLLLVAAPELRAQQGATPTAAAASTAGSPTRAPRALTDEELKGWRSIRTSTLSADGRWLVYLLAPNEGDAEVIVRSTRDRTERRFPVGEPAAGSALEVSADGQWAAFTVFPSRREQERLRRDRRPIVTKAAVVNLATGEQRTWDRVRRFAFSGDRPTHVALHLTAEGATPAATGGAAGPGGPGAAGGAGAAARPQGSDLLLVELATGTPMHVGDVAEFAFSENGEWLAWTVESRDRLGNGVQLRNLRTAAVHALDGGRHVYRQLAWADSGVRLAVLRGVIDSAARDTSYAVLGFSRFGAALPQKTELAAAGRRDFPGGMRVSSDRAPRWSADGAALLFGIIEAPSRAARALAAGADSAGRDGTPRDSTRRDSTRRDSTRRDTTGRAGERAAGAEEEPNLVLWHWKDPRLQAQQQVEATRDRRFTYLTAYRVGDDRIVRLADSALRDVTLAPGDRWAVAVDNRAYERQGNLDGLRYRDLWAIDARTGERTRVVERALGQPMPSPDGSRLLYWSNADAHWHVHDFATKADRNITTGLPVSFVNVEDDHNFPNPAAPVIGWARDGSAVLLSDLWDVWQVPVRGGQAVNLTRTGRAEGVRYQRALQFDPRRPGIDLRQPLLLAAYGERTKKEGVARVEPGRAGARALLWDDARFGVTRARDAQVYAYTRQTFTEFPDWWVADGQLQNPRRLTDANPQQRELAWSPGARLVSYVTDKGDSLQAALFLPAGYEPGTTYPTVVYIYEKLSQNLHQYAVPNETRALNPSVYTSRGYAVLMPDIVYEVNDPGMSAVWSVVPAVKAAIGTGVVDSARVGLHGHSWGGYQTAFLVTQTNIFKSAIAGAPLTDMVSMYSSVYWNSGATNQSIFQSSQGRFKGNFLENYEAYVRNSPNRHADRIQTPLLMLHNDKDGAVDFNQGITFFNTLRQLGKDVVLLQYVGENHGLARPANQKDYAVRMREYFDHHLRGAPAPDWMKEGVPHLRMQEHLEARKKAGVEAKVVF